MCAEKCVNELKRVRSMSKLLTCLLLIVATLSPAVFSAKVSVVQCSWYAQQRYADVAAVPTSTCLR